MKITEEVIKNHGIKLDEYKKILKLISREPNLLELGIFSAMWNEHCSYKSSRKYLKKLPTKGKNVIHEGEKIKFEDVTYSVTGKAVSYITDTMECNGIGKLAEDNDLLILEGTLLDNLRHNARKSKH